MSNTSKVEMAPASVRDNARFLYRVASSAAYMTLVLGYFLSVVQVCSLTAFNFVGFTAIQIVYAALLWLLVRSGASPIPVSQRRATRRFPNLLAACFTEYHLWIG